MRHIIVPLSQRLTADDSLYGVRVRGDERPDGSWQPCIEFESRSGIHLETCPEVTWANSIDLKLWAERLDPGYLQRALANASRGPIRPVRRTKRT